MKPDITPAEPTFEERPLAKLAKKAIADLTKRSNEELQQIIVDAAEDQGINPSDGWGYDHQNQVWKREVK